MHRSVQGLMISWLLLAACSCPSRGGNVVRGEERAAHYIFRGLEPAQREALAAVAAAEDRPVVVVALSGGAQNGAFGAGILCHWRDRPRHVDMWTGISTGALLLTHAVLIGPEIRFQAADLPREKERYRAELEEAYTTWSEPDLMSKRSYLTLLNSSAMASMEGLRGLVARYLTDEVIDRLAQAVSATDVVVVGTTDMDTGRFVAWDMKQLARDQRYDFYRKVVFTSCLEPAAMDPEYIAGHMHADGGVRYQIFAPPLQAELSRCLRTEGVRARHRSVPARPAPPPLLTVHLLVNGRLEEQEVQTGTCLLDIALRAVDLVTLESKLGNLLRIQTLVEDLALQITGDPRSGQFQVLLASIDPTFTGSPASHFDPGYMRALFEHGKARMAADKAWRPYRISGMSLVFTEPR